MHHITQRHCGSCANGDVCWFSQRAGSTKGNELPTAKLTICRLQQSQLRRLASSGLLPYEIRAKPSLQVHICFSQQLHC